MLKGQENVKSLQGQAIVADQGFQAKIAELAGKLPGDVQSNYDKLHSLALSDAKFRHQLAQDKFNNAFKVSQANVKVQEFNARQQMEATRLARTEFQQNREYGLSLARLGISQKNLQLRIATNAFKMANGGYTPKELNKIQVEAMGLAHSYFSGSTSTKTYAGVSNTTGKGSTSKGIVDTQRASTSVTKGIDYPAALTKMMQKGVPVQIAIRALNSVYPPGQQLNAAGLENYLGPLAPANIAAAADKLNAQGGVALGNAAGYGFNPYVVDTTSLKHLSANGQAVVNGILGAAKQYLGTPYLWGGESPKGFDCSGLAQYLYAQENVSIPRTTYDQFQSGLTVPRSQLEAGDLVFFRGSDSKVVNGVTLPGHVGIYVGDGKFIQAPHTGSVVQVSNLSGYPGYMGARRYVH
jgi:cell wall-associated NlpC family hydrolase